MVDVVIDILIGAVLGVVSFVGSTLLMVLLIKEFVYHASLTNGTLATILVGSAVVSALIYRLVSRVSRTRSISFALSALATALWVLLFGIFAMGAAQLSPDS